MKQIFDLLREQMRTNSNNAEAKMFFMIDESRGERCVYGEIDMEENTSKTWIEAISLVDEAEAKWNDSKSKAIEILKTEKACVERNIKNQCNRECAKCDLLREDAEILRAYDDAILALGSEAKWEEDCCEWEYRKHYVNCLCKCNGIMVEHDWAIGFKFCPYCGKPIKITEVE